MKEDLGTYHADTEKYAELVQRVYDDHAPMTIPPEYAGFVEGNFLQFLVRLSRYKFASKMLRASDSVLEVGSGSGGHSAFFQQRGASVVAVDITLERAISTAQKLHMIPNGEGRAYRADAESLPYALAASSTAS